MDMIFTDKTDWQLYFRLFCYELMLLKSMVILMNLKSMKKDGVKENRMNELGFFWDCDEQILKDMENVIRTEFYIWEGTHPKPSQEGVRSKKEVLV
jgi:hypothetical protein